MLEAAQPGARGELDFLVGAEREDGPGVGGQLLLQHLGARSLVAGVACMCQDPLNRLCRGNAPRRRGQGSSGVSGPVRRLLIGNPGVSNGGKAWL